MNLFARIDNYSKKLTSSEARILEYAKGSYPHGVLGPARIIAEKVGVSTATVTRFFDKLGYQSYAQLQDEARSEVSAKLSSPLARVYLTGSEVPSSAAILKGTFATDANNLARTYKSNRIADFQKVIQTILRLGEHTLYVMGAKNSGPVAQYLHANLSACVRHTVLLSGDDGTLADALVDARADDVLFVISIRRYAHNTIQVAKYFKEIGAKVICITDGKNSPVAQRAETCLFVDLNSLSPFDSFTAAFTLCNAIVGAVVAQRRKDVEQSLLRSQKLSDFLRVFEK
ncbi:MurR/RpiR family transcriptional regulator [Castellaniella sp.]|uniref:MurR/RpiR family transcriptional regulator n=1 Tax=Castellaniella sp. TaxID=1955812 RepID=UPI0035640864